MKIGIVTFHFVPNSGAVLQCWALQEKLNELGYEAEVINYQPRYHTEKYRPLKNPLSKGAGSLLNRFKIMYYDRNALERWNRLKKYGEFCQNLMLSTIVRGENDWYKIHPETYDAIICGSDQIWNIFITNGSFDRVYFADIPGFSGKKISYAASIGETDLENNYESLQELLSDFSSISVREKSDMERLASVIDSHISVVPDPTFLLPQTRYDAMQQRLDTPEHYILVYAFGKEDILTKTIDYVGRIMGIPIISISPYKIQTKMKSKWEKGVGPGEFLYYISHADYIVTNSFHCSVFSILYNKQFCVVKHPTRNARIDNLMAISGITNRIIENIEQVRTVTREEIDYSNVNKNLEKQRLMGEQYLVHALND